MQAHQKAEKTFQPFGYDYINDYVEQHKKNSAWNETQLTIILETLVNFIDCYIEEFLKAGFPLDPVWIFEKLLAINAFIQEHGFARGDLRLKELEEPIFQFQEFMKRSDKWLIPFDVLNLISKPHQFIREEWFYSIDLARLDKETATDEEWLKMRTQQGKEMHAIVNELLSTAINRIKKTDAYQQAVASGKLYYKPEAGMPLKDAKPSQSSTKSTPVSTPSSSPARGLGFFGISSSVDRSQQSSSSSQEKESEQSSEWGLGNSTKSED